MVALNIRRTLAALPGWRTKRKLVVLESDDWGSIRMPSVEAYNNLQKAGIDLISDEGAIFNKFDSLATTQDISGLFEVLTSVKDKLDRPAVITPLAVVANPDFEKIRDSGFTTYYYEGFTDTIRRYKGCENSFKLWQEGINGRLFVPQFHGREHLNVKVWMRALTSGNKVARTGFDHCFWGMSTQHEPDIGLEFQAAFDFSDPSDLIYHTEVITTGLELFKDLFGYKASYFVPPNGPFSSGLEKHLSDNGIKYLSMQGFNQSPWVMVRLEEITFDRKEESFRIENNYPQLFL
jgi:hypothetical protein